VSNVQQPTAAVSVAAAAVAKSNPALTEPLLPSAAAASDSVSDSVSDSAVDDPEDGCLDLERLMVEVQVVRASAQVCVKTVLVY
jgi:hypothetical protein